MEKNVMEITFLTEKIFCMFLFTSTRGAKVDSGQKLTQINNKKPPR